MRWAQIVARMVRERERYVLTDTFDRENLKRPLTGCRRGSEDIIKMDGREIV